MKQHLKNGWGEKGDQVFDLEIWQMSGYGERLQKTASIQRRCINAKMEVAMRA